MTGERLRALRREPRPPSDAELEALAARDLLKVARRDVRRRRAAGALLDQALAELDEAYSPPQT
ncbi:hypothetical protein [Umezawaea sp. Da 62-37]|uniref:hypothetical protein n=1 Tax=Umezawaea sp. Da 62-37 TaxID=3075927 RepID=UPI0028F6CB42|nr:hypothetical protein [Umezawaea sp. Da 62-37]WNV83712.1 hypothetical protein RM788_36850 [Umezawaea sp. Da 62-37]